MFQPGVVLPYAELFFAAFLCYIVPLCLLGTPFWLFCLLLLEVRQVRGRHITSFRDRCPLGYELIVIFAADLDEIEVCH